MQEFAKHFFYSLLLFYAMEVGDIMAQRKYQFVKMARPVIYRVIPRFITGLALAIIWDRTFNEENLYSMTEHAFFVLGMIFFALAWVAYLKLDGLIIHHLNENLKKGNTNKHKFRHMIDYSDEEPSPDDTLDENEKIAANLTAYILTGLCFILPAVYSMVFL